MCSGGADRLAVGWCGLADSERSPVLNALAERAFSARLASGLSCS